MNRFDRFCETSTPQMVNTLRSLRDRFKETLSYIVGMRQEVAYLPEPAILGDMYELFDSHICYVGALTEEDGRHMLREALHTGQTMLGEADVEAMLRLSGGFPSLLKTIGQWWMLTPQRPAAPTDWGAALLEHGAIQHRLARLWQGLTQEEKLALSEVYKQQAVTRQAIERKRIVGVEAAELAAPTAPPRRRSRAARFPSCSGWPRRAAVSATAPAGGSMVSCWRPLSPGSPAASVAGSGLTS